MAVYVVTIGDELLLGETVNTNASWLGERLNGIGLTIAEVITVPDTVEAIRDAVERCLNRASLVVVTGGLGPTHDDLTRDAISEALGRPLQFDAAWFKRVQDRFRARGRTVPESNRTQAMVPTGFEILPNDFGTAPGLYLDTEVDGRMVSVVVLPGVPREMRHLVDDRLIPKLGMHDRNSRFVINVGTAGIGESHLQDLLGDLSSHLAAGTGLAYLPSLTGLRLRITGRGADTTEARARAEDLADVVETRARRFVFSRSGESLEEVVGRLLAERGLTVGIAESCTGGRVADRLTDVAGSSRYVLGGVVAYCNSVKVGLLGVGHGSLDDHGSVSEAVAREMAEGVRLRLGADFGVSSTGILGPGGGTPDKPVGTVWIGISDATGTDARLLQLGEGREDNKMRASTAVLNFLRLRVLSATTA